MTAPSNYSILQSNLLPTFKTDEGKRAFLWACDRADADRYQHVAEAFAHEVDDLVDFLRWAIDGAARAFEHVSTATREDLLAFILRRHAHHRFPREAKAWI